MKKNTVKRVAVSIVIVLGLICIVLGYCKWLSDNQLYLSVERVLKREFEYQGRYKYKDGIVCYYYSIHSYDPDAISLFAKTINECAAVRDSLINVIVGADIGGGSSIIFILSNYSGDTEKKMYNGVYNLSIGCNDINYDDSHDVRIYSKIESVKELHVVRQMQDIAENEGIDWYDYWPELEIFEVEE